MRYLILSLVMLLMSCAANTPEIKTETKIIDTSCNWAKVIMISVNDELTDGTAKQILAHNRLVKKNCPK